MSGGVVSGKESTSREYVIPNDENSPARDNTGKDNVSPRYLDSQINGSSDISKVIDRNLESYKKDLKSI